jgi:hypothetical protein
MARGRVSGMTVKVSLLRLFYLGNDDEGGAASACQGCAVDRGAVSIWNTETNTRTFYYVLCLEIEWRFCYMDGVSAYVTGVRMCINKVKLAL